MNGYVYPPMFASLSHELATLQLHEAVGKILYVQRSDLKPFDSDVKNTAGYSCISDVVLKKRFRGCCKRIQRTFADTIIHESGTVPAWLYILSLVSI